MQQTHCTKILHTAEVAPVIKSLCAEREDLVCIEIPPFNEILESRPESYPFTKSIAEAQNDPIVVLHSSGSTGQYILHLNEPSSSINSSPSRSPQTNYHDPRDLRRPRQ